MSLCQAARQSRGIWPGGSGRGQDVHFCTRPVGCVLWKLMTWGRQKEQWTRAVWAALAIRAGRGPGSQAGGCTFLVPRGALVCSLCSGPGPAAWCETWPGLGEQIGAEVLAAQLKVQPGAPSRLLVTPFSLLCPPSSSSHPGMEAWFLTCLQGFPTPSTNRGWACWGAGCGGAEGGTAPSLSCCRLASSSGDTLGASPRCWGRRPAWLSLVTHSAASSHGAGGR